MREAILGSVALALSRLLDEARRPASVREQAHSDMLIGFGAYGVATRRSRPVRTLALSA